MCGDVPPQRTPQCQWRVRGPPPQAPVRNAGTEDRGRWPRITKKLRRRRSRPRWTHSPFALTGRGCTIQITLNTYFIWKLYFQWCVHLATGCLIWLCTWVGLTLIWISTLLSSSLATSAKFPTAQNLAGCGTPKSSQPNPGARPDEPTCSAFNT